MLLQSSKLDRDQTWWVLGCHDHLLDYRRWIITWDEKEKGVEIGFKVNIVAAGEIGPSGEFYRATSSEGWTHAAAEVLGVLFGCDGRTDCPIQQGNDPMVVFFGGVHFKYRKLPLGRVSEFRAIPTNEAIDTRIE